MAQHTSAALPEPAGGGRGGGCTRPPASGHPGSQQPPSGRGPPPAVRGCPLGRTWPTARAVALLRVDPTRGSETGTLQGLRWHNLPREGKGEEGPGKGGGRALGGGEADGRRRLRREGVQGKGTGMWREASRRRPLQTATQPGVMPPPPLPFLDCSYLVWILGGLLFIPPRAPGYLVCDSNAGEFSWGSEDGDPHRPSAEDVAANSFANPNPFAHVVSSARGVSALGRPCSETAPGCPAGGLSRKSVHG